MKNYPCYEPRSYSPSTTSQSSGRRREARRSALLIVLLSLLVIGLSLTGCATQTPPPCVKLQAPLKPVLLTPLPKDLYSISVQADLLRWQKLLMATPPTPKP